jgi:ABC-type multidrug transport system ATPase subunit
MNCIETRDIVHRFSRNETVLNGISLQVPTGCIYGFLGPNGAGKTTTLRLILGLLKGQQGSIAIFGQSLRTHRIEILGKVGSLIESPSLYDHLSATENLALLQKVYRCPKEQIARVLAMVGLAGTGTKRTGKFSLGMKQRLSIAMALLHGPSLLILDEPTNGLDPNGIMEVRELLKDLNRERGITVVISSHILAEVEKLVSHLGIITKGHLVFQGSLEELKNRQALVLSVSLAVSDVARALQVVSGTYPKAHIEGGMLVLPAIPSAAVASVNRLLIESGLEVSEIAVVKNDLERIFLALVDEPRR